MCNFVFLHFISKIIFVFRCLSLRVVIKSNDKNLKRKWNGAISNWKLDRGKCGTFFGANWILVSCLSAVSNELAIRYNREREDGLMRICENRLRDYDTLFTYFSHCNSSLRCVRPIVKFIAPILPQFIHIAPRRVYMPRLRLFFFFGEIINWRAINECNNNN